MHVLKDEFGSEIRARRRYRLPQFYASQQGAITDVSFSGGIGPLDGSYAGKLTDGNTVLTFTEPGETLTGQLTSPLLGQTDTVKGGLFLDVQRRRGECGEG